MTTAKNNNSQDSAGARVYGVYVVGRTGIYYGGDIFNSRIHRRPDGYAEENTVR